MESGIGRQKGDGRRRMGEQDEERGGSVGDWGKVDGRLRGIVWRRDL